MIFMVSHFRVSHAVRKTGAAPLLNRGTHGGPSGIIKILLPVSRLTGLTAIEIKRIMRGNLANCPCFVEIFARAPRACFSTE